MTRVQAKLNAKLNPLYYITKHGDGIRLRLRNLKKKYNSEEEPEAKARVAAELRKISKEIEDMKLEPRGAINSNELLRYQSN